MKEPFLSIITVTFNSAKTLPDTLHSVDIQSDRNFEYIVIDGASTDGTLDLLRDHPKLITKLVSEPDSGIYDAMNKGIQLARGKYVSFLNSDDAYFENTVKNVRLQALPETEILYGNIQKERVLGHEVLKKVAKPQLELMPQTMGVFHPASFVRRDLFKRLGSFDLRFKQASDYHWMLRAYLNDVNFTYIDQTLTRFRLGGLSNHSCETYREAAIIQEELGTGYHSEMLKLHKKCLKKQNRNKFASKLADWPIFKSIYRKQVKKRWT
jgi:glycosyltransferase involved in cell wall biosynthesis